MQNQAGLIAERLAARAALIPARAYIRTMLLADTEKAKRAAAGGKGTR